jgi:GTPase SAR1 family protein
MGKLFKVLVWGKNAVGKTSLIEQLAYGRVEEKVREVCFSFSYVNLTFLAISRDD